MKGAVLALVALALSVPAGAVEPDDFSAGFELAVPPGSPVVELALPPAVYRGVLRDDLGDLRVFNGAGNPVPHGLEALRPPRGDRRLHRVAAFAVSLPVAADPSGVSVTVVRDDRGVIRSMRADDSGEARTQRAYILPVTGTDRAFTSIRLEWKRDRRNFVQPVILEGSDDLADWTLIDDHWLIVNLRQGTRLVRHDRLNVPQTRWAYLRVRAVGEATLPEVRTALLDVGERSFAPTLQWSAVPVRADPETPGRWLFETPRGMQMRSIEIGTSVPNAYARVRLRQRVASTGEWNKGLVMPVYRLEYDAGTIRNRPRSMLGNSVREWAIDVPDAGRAFDGVAPSVRIGWLAHTLVFVARGEGPWTLAYGSATADPVVMRARTLLEELQQPAALGADGFSLPNASIVREVVLGGESALVVPPPPTDWNRRILWAVLVGAVVMLLLMAVRLMREPRSGTAGSD